MGGGSMNEELLRRWVRGELPAGERRVVTRWIVRCTAPELGPLLVGMAREAQQERVDAVVAARGPRWARLVERWNTLLDAGRASVSAGDDALVLASVDGAAPGTPLGLEDVDGARHATLLAGDDPDEEAALFLTDDDGATTRLAGPAPATAAMRAPLPSERGPRATVWAVRGPALPRDGDAGDALGEVLARPDVAAWAVREHVD